MWQLRGRHGFTAGRSQSDLGWKHRPRLCLCCRETEKRDDSDAMKAKSRDISWKMRCPTCLWCRASPSSQVLALDPKAPYKMVKIHVQAADQVACEASFRKISRGLGDFHRFSRWPSGAICWWWPWLTIPLGPCSLTWRLGWNLHEIMESRTDERYLTVATLHVFFPR